MPTENKISDAIRPDEKASGAATIAHAVLPDFLKSSSGDVRIVNLNEVKIPSDKSDGSDGSDGSVKKIVAMLTVLACLVFGFGAKASTFSITNDTYYTTSVGFYTSNSVLNFTFASPTNFAAGVSNTFTSTGYTGVYTEVTNTSSPLYGLGYLTPFATLTNQNGANLSLIESNYISQAAIPGSNTNATAGTASPGASQVATAGFNISGNAATASYATNAGSLIPSPSRTLYVSTNGNDATAQPNSILFPWKTVYDFTNSAGTNIWLGVMSAATHPGDVVTFLTDEASPVLPFFSEGVAVNLNTYTLTIVSNSASIAMWPVWLGQQGTAAYFNFPTIFMSDNCTISNGAMYVHQTDPYGVGQTSHVFFGMKLWTNIGGEEPNGTNISQWLWEGANNSVQFFPTNCGEWPMYGLTNNGATNFSCNNVFFDSESYDIMYIDDYFVGNCSDTNGLGSYAIQPWKPSRLWFTDCSFFTLWDANIIEGAGCFANFKNCRVIRELNDAAIDITCAFTAGAQSTININGGSSYTYMTGSNLLTSGLFGSRNDDAVTGWQTNGCRVNVQGFVDYCEPGSNFPTGDGISIAGGLKYSTNVFGWYVQTNGVPASMFTTNAMGALVPFNNTNGAGGFLWGQLNPP